eukprot:TRINITY_DN1807_c1_g1_i1.p1 TRINITY_DN1807_c1_g1~~TRINITY_DN1807_c1_g1_i1.p1  ORF type:complete len:783 (+),score=178.74 TRINITY_DN1807_c1_g1_i1:78-2426(+)
MSQPSPVNKAKTQTGNVQVMVRVRPFNNREKKYSEEQGSALQPVVMVNGGRVAVLDNNMEQEREAFEYDEVFWSCTGYDSPNAFSDQPDVYQKTGKVMLESAIKGYNCTIFAYGQTGSGKTYTMLGSPDSRGVSYLFIDELFKHIESQKIDDPGTMYTVEVSFMEIYNEQVRDLFNKKQKAGQYSAIQIRQDPIHGILVVGLTRKPVASAQQCAKEMEAGVNERALAETKMNATSSRSHAICQIRIQQANPATGLRKNALVNLVDLAGSEKLKMSQVEGQAAVEAKNINLSLTTLRRVFDTLIENSKKKNPKTHAVAPYRDSKLTWVLKESLGGNSKTMMVAAISPHIENVEDTLSTLRYALKAKSIVCKVICNEQASAKMVESLQDQVEKLKAELKEREAGGISEEEREELVNQYEEQMQANMHALEEAKAVDSQMQEKRKELEAKVDKLEEDKKIITQNHNKSKFAAAFRSAFAVKKEKKETNMMASELKLLKIEAGNARKKLLENEEQMAHQREIFRQERSSRDRDDVIKNRQLETHRKACNTMESELTSLQSVRRDLEFQLQALTDTSLRKDTVINTLKDELSALRSENDRYRSTYEAGSVSVSQELDAVKRDRDEILRKKEAYKKQCSMLQLIHEADTKIIDGLKEEKWKLQQQLQNSASALESAELATHELQATTEKAARLGSEVKFRDKQVRELESNLQAYKNAKADWTASNASVRCELDRVTREHFDLRSRVSAQVTMTMDGSPTITSPWRGSQSPSPARTGSLSPRYSMSPRR